MVVRFIKIPPPLSTSRVSFYTVVLGTTEGELSEFEKFDKLDFSSHLEELGILASVLSEMGLRGAKPYYFVKETFSEKIPIVPEALKQKNHKDFGVRLYCKRLSNQVVILFNGGIKTKLNPHDCPNVSAHFRRAERISQKVDKALNDQLLRVVDATLLFSEDFEIDI